MKKLLTSVIAVALMLTLLLGAVACGDDGETFTMNITGIKGVTDPVIDGTAKTVTFTVQNDRDAFPLTDIVFTSDFELAYEAYADKELTQKYEGASVPLKEGDNTFWVKGWVDGIADVYDVFEFRVRRIASAPEIVSFDVVDWQTDYYLYEYLGDLDLTITWSSGDPTVQDLTADMLIGFDTSTAGEKTVTISYNGMTVTKTITVSEPVLSDFEVGSFRTEYLQGDELDLDGAYLNIAGRKVAIVAGMVSGFDASSGGEKTVTITYGGATKTVKVNVTGTGPVIPPGGDDLTLEYFDEQLFRILGNFVKKSDMVNISPVVYPYFKSAGVSKAQVKLLADAALEMPVIDIVQNALEMSSAEVVQYLIVSLLDEDCAEQIVEYLNLCFEIITPQGLSEVAEILIDMANENYVSENGNGFKVLFSLMGSISSSFITEEYDTIAELFDENDELAELFDRYTSPDKDGLISPLGSMKDVVLSNDAIYFATNFLDILREVTSTDRAAIVDLAAIANNIVQAIIDGDDFSTILSGKLEGATYNDIAAQLNTLGDIFDRLNEKFADDAMLRQSAEDIVKGMIAANNTYDNDMLAQSHNLVPVVFALDKVVVSVLQNATAAQLSGLYLDYDALTKADEESRPVDIGRFAVDIAKIVAPAYNALSAEDKATIDEGAATVKNIIGIDLAGMVTWLKEVDATETFTEDAYLEFAQEFFACLGNEIVSEPLSVQQYSPVFVSVGADKDTLAAAAKQVIQVYLSVDGSATQITDLERYAWSFNSAVEGFFEATLTVDGKSAVVSCYAYDETSPSKVKIYDDRFALPGILLMQNASLEEIDWAAMISPVTSYVPTTLIHENGSHFDISADINTFTARYIDTSKEPGVYAAIGSVEHAAFGTIEFPIVYRIVAEPIQSPENITSVSYNLPEVIPQNAQEIVGAEVRIEYAYNLDETYEDISLANISGLDLTTLGTQDITVNIDGLEPYQTSIEVVTEQEARTPKYAYVNVYIDLFTQSALLFTQDADFTSINVSVNINALYSGYDYHDSDLTYADLAGVLEPYGLTASISGMSTAECTKGATATITLTDKDGTVFSTCEFDYKVYSPEADPAEVFGASLYHQYDMVFSEKDIADKEALLDRLIHYSTWSDSYIRFVMTDNSIAYYVNEAELDPEENITNDNELILSQTEFTVELNETYGSLDPNVTYYDLKLTIGYFELNVTIEVIPDWYAIMPTEINIFSVENIVIQDSVIGTEHFSASVEFGNGYETVDIDMEAEANNFTVTADTSQLGYTTVTVTYKGLATTFDIEVISLEQAVCAHDFTKNFMPAPYSSLGIPTGFDEQTLLDQLYCDFWGMQYFSLGSYACSAAEFNETVKDNIYFDELYVEIEDINTSTTGKKSARVWVVGKVGDKTARDLLATIDINVYPSDLAEGTKPVYIFWSGSVSDTSYRFDRSQINDGSYLDLVNVDVALNFSGTPSGTTENMTLSYLKEHYGATIEVVADPEISDQWVIHIETEYAYCDIPNVVIFEDVTA